MLKDRPAVHDRPVTEADELAAYRSFIMQAGPYTIVGARLTHHRAYTRDPAGTNTDEEFEFSVTGDTLVVQSILEDGSLGRVLTGRRVG